MMYAIKHAPLIEIKIKRAGIYIGNETYTIYRPKDSNYSSGLAIEAPQEGQ